MSDPPSVQDLIDALECLFTSRGLSLSCPCCGSGDWGVNGLFTLVRPAEAQAPADWAKLSVLPVVCDDCGLVRFFSAARLKELVAGAGGG